MGIPDALKIITALKFNRDCLTPISQARTGTRTYGFKKVFSFIPNADHAARSCEEPRRSTTG